MAKNDTVFNGFLSSLIQDIKSYSGTDPLLPWLRGIKKMKETLPSDVLKDKLPRFLQKCTRSFESDRRYKNDMRYLRVWLQLMDFVGDPRTLLKTMEENHIGVTRSLFYQAYALFYEKMKKFEDAEKMYHLGVRNLAEPAGELQKSYEQFLHRMERHKKKRIQLQERRTSRRPLSSMSIPLHSNEAKENCENICRATESQHEGSSSETLPDENNVGMKKILKENSKNVKPLVEPNHNKDSATSFGIGLGSTKREHVCSTGSISEQQVNSKRESESRTFRGEDTMVARFVDTAIVGKSEIEDACHHGLVEPTINMKEAMNAINDMFREPLDTAPVGRRSHRSQKKEDRSFDNGFNVFIDENLDNQAGSLERKEEKCVSQPQHSSTQNCEPHQESFKIYVDDEESDENDGRNDEEEHLEEKEVQNLRRGSSSSSRHLNGFVFPSPKDDLPSESSDDPDAENSPPVKLRREDTVVRRFVGSAILDEPEVENVCHHGLVDPTINLKEAMNDINNMFGEPIDFVRAKRPKKQDKAPVKNQDPGGFLILPDDDLETQPKAPRKLSNKSSDSDLFEPTVFTKEALDDINKMFGMPLDF
ncbi:hypothetical protein EZV62_025948 [Acer yangbiense]|uniref:BUB1 N-terminal domain-containing protein n=1 Tax=Acer yangbiense TaxID=1000413 RepID=A0A5C7GZK0_9ROSI|nr:hypothetical protein EZV62_025948 [Acer yangbiense]